MVNIERLKDGIKARDFFMECLHSQCEHVAIENPVPMSIYAMPDATQIIQPFMFGDPYSKKTCLWLRGIPPLKATKISVYYHPFINGGGGRMMLPNYKGQTFAGGGKARSKTFNGVAKAMAEQWSDFILNGDPQMTLF